MQFRLTGMSGSVDGESLESLEIKHAKLADCPEKCGLRLRQLRGFDYAAAMSQEPAELKLQWSSDNPGSRRKKPIISSLDRFE